jgi:hypothetical protein
LRNKIDKGIIAFLYFNKYINFLGIDIDVNDIDDPHLITGIIKLFLRCLPEPLLTYQLFSEFIEVAETSKEDPELACPILKAIVEKLPYPNKY